MLALAVEGLQLSNYRTVVFSITYNYKIGLTYKIKSNFLN
jgi:hypothetical protein